MLCAEALAGDVELVGAERKPHHLDELCFDLLRTRPEDRPNGEQVLDRVRRGAAPAAADLMRPRARDDGVALVGREQHLRALRDAFARTRRGQGTTVYVGGASGMGKTALVRYFLDEVGRDPNAVVLTGRCYERESVPYKALDSLVDALCRYLIRLPRHEADALLPRGVVLLGQVFPVLRRVEAVDRARRVSVAIPDPQELRRRAFAALRELLGRLAEQRPLVLFIDDLQWGDVDSAPLLDALMRPPEVPPLLLLACYRSDEVQRSELLSALFRQDLRPGDASPSAKLEVGPLSEDESAELAAALLRKAGAPVDAARAIARESGGNAYFVHELVRSIDVEAADQPTATTGLSLDAVIHERVAKLPEAARTLLEVVAVAGKPIQQRVANHAAGLEPRDGPALALMLRAAQLARTAGAREGDVIECYHDRIRETVVARLPEERLVNHYRSLASAVLLAERPDSETLADYYRGAGEHEIAADYAIQAADQAARALAFDRAAILYRQALQLRTLDEQGQAELAIRTKLADALFRAGRAAEAAAEYLTAAGLAMGGTQIDLMRRAADAYLKTGRREEGFAALGAALSGVGERLPKTPLSGVPPLLWRRLLLRLRGLRFSERAVGELSVNERLAVDVCWSAASALGGLEPMWSAALSTRTLLLALRAGEPYRLSRAMAMEGAYIAASGAARRGNDLMDRGTALA